MRFESGLPRHLPVLRVLTLFPRVWWWNGFRMLIRVFISSRVIAVRLEVTNSNNNIINSCCLPIVVFCGLCFLFVVCVGLAAAV